MAEKINLNDVHFIIPIQIDSKDRLENVQLVTEHILNHFNTNISILEAAAEKNEKLEDSLSKHVELYFIEDTNPDFHRTKYINYLVEHTMEPILAVWDSDVILNISQIVESVELLRSEKYDIVYPHDGRFLDTGFDVRTEYLDSQNINTLNSNMDQMKLIYGDNSYGGGFFINRVKYIESGMENENFLSWGLEDLERIHRWYKLGYKYKQVQGPIYHLSHFRGINSKYATPDYEKRNKAEFKKIYNMSKEELLTEIRKWKNKRQKQTFELIKDKQIEK